MSASLILIKRFISIEGILIIAIGMFCLSGYISAPFALLLGIVLALFITNPLSSITEKYTTLLLQGSIVLLGLGVNVFEAATAGYNGLFITLISIVSTFLLGALLGKALRINNAISFLLSAGTAICGGSAIAALSPITKAKANEISVALGTVFVLNAIALFIFPLIGHALHLSEQQFGFWAAIAIHDTSSVVGAAQQYGEHALQIATTVKLERALWILPVSLITSIVLKKRGRSIKFPYFILLFLASMLIGSFIPSLESIQDPLVMIAKRSMCLTLFLIGLSFKPSMFSRTDLAAFAFGVLLWLIVSVLSLLAIVQYL